MKSIYFTCFKSEKATNNPKEKKPKKAEKELESFNVTAPTLPDLNTIEPAIASPTSQVNLSGSTNVHMIPKASLIAAETNERP